MKIAKTILLALVLPIANNGLAGSDGTQETWVGPGGSWAGVSLGPKGAKELKKLGKRYRSDRGMSQTRQVWKWLRPDGRLETFFIHTVNNGVIDAQPGNGVTIDLIRSTTAGLRTAAGIAVGSTLDQIRRSLPDVPPVEGSPTIFDDVKRGIAFEFSSAPIGRSICIGVMVHPSGKTNVATQQQVAEVLEHGAAD